jgi:hypothetical protein
LSQFSQLLKHQDLELGLPDLGHLLVSLLFHSKGGTVRQSDRTAPLSGLFHDGTFNLVGVLIFQDVLTQEPVIHDWYLTLSEQTNQSGLGRVVLGHTGGQPNLYLTAFRYNIRSDFLTEVGALDILQPARKSHGIEVPGSVSISNDVGNILDPLTAALQSWPG